MVRAIEAASFPLTSAAVDGTDGLPSLLFSFPEVQALRSLIVVGGFSFLCPREDAVFTGLLRF